MTSISIVTRKGGRGEREKRITGTWPAKKKWEWSVRKIPGERHLKREAVVVDIYLSLYAHALY